MLTFRVQQRFKAICAPTQSDQSLTCADPEGGGWGEEIQTPKRIQKYRVSEQCWSGSPENHKANKPAFIVEPSRARQRNAI